MVPPLEESEDGDRVSFPRWGKRNVVSFHFTELVLEITVLEMLPVYNNFLFLCTLIHIILVLPMKKFFFCSEKYTLIIIRLFTAGYYSIIKNIFGGI